MKKLHEESLAALSYLRKNAVKKKAVFVSGNFNVIHPGHLRLLRFAKECGNYLVVGVYGSQSPGAIVQEELRLMGINSISYVDFSFILRDTPESFIKELKPPIVVKGKEHEGRDNPEAKEIDKYGGRLVFGSGDISFSSIDFIKQEFQETNISSIKKPIDFLSRYNFSKEQLIETVDKMGELYVCVVGDVIVDEYITCDPIGMSQEDPTIVVTPILSNKFVGGAGIVAAHAKGLGSKVHLFTVCGADETAAFLKDNIEKYNVDLNMYEDSSRPTTLKQRFRAQQKTLLRVSHLRQHSISKEIQKKFISDFRKVLNNVNLVILSDFNYGCLPQQLVDEIVSECEKRKIMIVADSQSSSQVGDVSRFHHMTLVTPTEREARLSMHDFESGLVVLCEKLRKKSQIKNIIVTLGSEGILIHADAKTADNYLTDRLPALNIAPKDVAGAGDSLLTCTSMALAVGSDLWQASYLGSLAAACQVGRIGNVPLTVSELKGEILLQIGKENNRAHFL